jgi:hypothetical protein
MRLRPDDVLERSPKTVGELAVGHKDHSNHQQSIVSGAAAAPANGHVATAHFCALRRKDQEQFATGAAPRYGSLARLSSTA